MRAMRRLRRRSCGSGGRGGEASRRSRSSIRRRRSDTPPHRWTADLRAARWRLFRPAITSGSQTPRRTDGAFVARVLLGHPLRLRRSWTQWHAVCAVTADGGDLVAAALRGRENHGADAERLSRARKSASVIAGRRRHYRGAPKWGQEILHFARSEEGVVRRGS
jgi:hypothetical protein